MAFRLSLAHESKPPDLPLGFSMAKPAPQSPRPSKFRGPKRLSLPHFAPRRGSATGAAPLGPGFLV